MYTNIKFILLMTVSTSISFKQLRYFKIFNLNIIRYKHMAVLPGIRQSLTISQVSQAVMEKEMKVLVVWNMFSIDRKCTL